MKKILSTNFKSHAYRVASGAALSVLLSFAFMQASRASEAAADKILLIGLDAQRNQTLNEIPASEYRRNLSLAFSAVNNSILPSLRGLESRSTKQRAWHFSSVAVGLGLSAQLGLGPIFSITAYTRLRLIFANSLNAIYPD